MDDKGATPAKPKKLAEYFAELVDLRWREYLTQERSPDVTSRQALLFALVRACVEGKLGAIQMSLDRLDGPVAKRIETILPKFYTVYPYARSVAGSVDEASPFLPSSTELANPGGVAVQISPPSQLDEQSSHPRTELDLPSGKLRPVLEAMLDASQSVPVTILKAVRACDKYDFSVGNPTVKSAMIAGLVSLAHSGKLTAIAEVLDQIDGKVAEAYHLMGDDIITVSYAEVAPIGAELNEDGVYQLENKAMASVWVPRLEGEGRGSRR